jgi:hypothetical protein
MFIYLKHPSVSSSIMPPQFFTKFPKKEPLEIDDPTLIALIKAYTDYFDIIPKIKIINEKKQK